MAVKTGATTSAPQRQTQNPQNPTAQQSAAPGQPGPDGATTADGAKPPKEKVVRVPWGKRDAEGMLIEKISARPADWDPRKNEGLKPNDFTSRADYLDFRALEAETRAKDLREEALAERNGTGKTTKSKQKRLLSLKEKYEELRAELEAAGVDVDAALSVKA